MAKFSGLYVCFQAVVFGLRIPCLNRTIFRSYICKIIGGRGAGIRVVVAKPTCLAPSGAWSCSEWSQRRKLPILLPCFNFSQSRAKLHMFHLSSDACHAYLILGRDTGFLKFISSFKAKGIPAFLLSIISTEQMVSADSAESL